MIALVRDADGGARLTLALLLALGLHAALIFGVSLDGEVARPPQPLRFEMVLPPPTEQPKPPESRTADPALKAETRAETVSPSAPAPKPAPAAPSVTVADPPVAKPVPPQPVAKPAPKPATVETPAKPPAVPPAPTTPKPARPPPAAAKPTHTAPLPSAKPKEPAQPVAKLTLPRSERAAPAGKTTESRASDRLGSTALLGQIANLEAETQRRASAGVRSKRVSPNDTQSLEGFYIAAWVRKVEQIGEMNFPEIARRLNLNTGPVLDVSIRADGSLKEVRVVRSSGYAELDQAAQRIVKLGAPYAPFPPALRQKYDVLQIARPWRFDPGGRVRGR